MKLYSLITLFPEAIEPYLESSILKRAQESIKKKGSKAGRKAVIKIQTVDPKHFVQKSRSKKNEVRGNSSNHAKPSARVDDKPYAGGPGMVLRAEPVLHAIDKAMRTKVGGKKVSSRKTATIFLTPQGAQFDQVMAQELAQYDHVIFVCGRYEGVDARVREIMRAKEVSVGPFILTGGELPAALMVDAIARHVPGVLGDFNSREDDRVASPDVYTRPEVLVWNKKKYRVPDVLLSGDHKKIEAWRQERREKRA